MHPWIDPHKNLSLNCKSLILGTHPPTTHEIYPLNFYYGNRSELWRFLQEAFPNDNIYSTGNLSDQPETIIQWLKSKSIGISDMVYETGNQFNTDNDMEVKSFNRYLKEVIESDQLKNIIFTSKSGKNSAFQLFKHWYNQNYPANLKNASLTVKPSNNEINLISITSPSPSARRGLAKSSTYNEWKLNNPTGNYDLYRIVQYKEIFSNL
jgi:G:T/U-mismatch repair DNA glycosylase